MAGFLADDLHGFWRGYQAGGIGMRPRYGGRERRAWLIGVGGHRAGGPRSTG